jgi:hypothetical protein
MPSVLEESQLRRQEEARPVVPPEWRSAQVSPLAVQRERQLVPEQ